MQLLLSATDEEGQKVSLNCQAVSSAKCPAPKLFFAAVAKLVLIKTAGPALLVPPRLPSCSSANKNPDSFFGSRVILRNCANAQCAHFPSLRFFETLLCRAPFLRVKPHACSLRVSARWGGIVDVNVSRILKHVVYSGTWCDLH